MKNIDLDVNEDIILNEEEYKINNMYIMTEETEEYTVERPKTRKERLWFCYHKFWKKFKKIMFCWCEYQGKPVIYSSIWL